MNNEQLSDEVLSINAIYAHDTLSILESGPAIYALNLPGEHHISLRLKFPNEYPEVPPIILGTQSLGDTLPKGAGHDIVDVARAILGEVYVPGSPCIFDLVEELVSKLGHILPEVRGASDESPQNAQRNGQQDLPDLTPTPSDHDQTSSLSSVEPPWILSEPFVEKKSVFVARAALVKSTDEARLFLHHLVATDKKVAKATHNITAWRIRGEGDVTFQDCDDDGETAAGGRLLHLLQLMDIWNVMVVVTRWYGGVHLGPDRFRLINSAARDAVVKLGVHKTAHEGRSGKK